MATLGQMAGYISPVYTVMPVNFQIDFKPLDSDHAECEGVSSNIKRLRCSLFTHCPIGAIDSTYKSRKISNRIHTIFEKFSGFFALIDSRSHAKNCSSKLRGFWGRRWEIKKFTPHFLPRGGSGGRKIFTPQGSCGFLLNFQSWRP